MFGDVAPDSMVTGHLMKVVGDVASLVDGSIVEVSSTIVVTSRSGAGR
jgi:hypothetical protein